MLSQPQQIQIVTLTISYPLVLMVGPSRASSSCTHNRHPPGTYTPKLGTPKTAGQIKEFVRSHLFFYLAKLFKLLGDPTNPCHLFDLDTVFTTPFVFSPKFFIINHLWFYWCLTTLHYIYVQLPILDVSLFLTDSSNAGTPAWNFLSQYSLIIWWKKQLQNILNHLGDKNVVPLDLFKVQRFLVISRPYFQSNDERIQSHDSPYEWMFLFDKPTKPQLRPLIDYLC